MKLQISNPRSQINSNDQNPKSQTDAAAGASVSVIGIWDLFGIWDLRFGASGLIVCALFLLSVVRAGDQAQWGQAFTRNMVSGETGLVDSFDPATGKNVKWVVPLGSQTWSTPVVAQGRVFIGTNNDVPRDPRHKGDRGVLLCLDEKDGHLLWQLVVPKLGADPYLDWPKAGICSPATVEGNRVYTVTNRNEVVCLDIEGMANGNDGPYQDEARHMTANGRSSLVARGSTLVPKDANDESGLIRDVTALDADIIWLFDIPRQAGTWPHDGAHGSVLIDGDFLYVNTCNALDSGHKGIRCPDGPSLICLDKKTGRLLARDYEGIGPRIFHSTWSPPALGVVNGQKRIFFCGGDGVVYGFEPLTSEGEKVRREEGRSVRSPSDPLNFSPSSRAGRPGLALRLAVRSRPDGSQRKRPPIISATAGRAPATSKARRSSTTTVCTSPSPATSGGARSRRGSSALMSPKKATPRPRVRSGPAI